MNPGSDAVAASGSTTLGQQQDVPTVSPASSRPPPRSTVDSTLFAEAVLAVVGLIPEARVLTYGDVAELLGAGGPRQVGRALSLGTTPVPWWRVLRAGGRPAEGLAARARTHYDGEGTSLSPGKVSDDPANYRVDLARARWVPTDAEYEVIADLGAALRGQSG